MQRRPGICFDTNGLAVLVDASDVEVVLPCPACEAAGVIWVYMGPPELQPQLPALEWTLVPDENRNVSKRMQACNWLQNLEGEVDSSHANFLHAQLGPDRKPIRHGQEPAARAAEDDDLAESMAALSRLSSGRWELEDVSRHGGRGRRGRRPSLRVRMVGDGRRRI